MFRFDNSRELICVEQVAKVHEQTLKQLVGLIGFTKNFSLDDFDYFVVCFILFHAFMLSLWGSVDDDQRKMIKYFGTFASLLYAVEIGFRVFAMGGFKNFFRDRRGQLHRLSNKFAFILTVLGLVATLMKYTTSYETLAHVLASVELCRVLVMSRSFRGIVYSFVLGIKPIKTFAALLVIVMYMFFILAHAMFRNVEVSNICCAALIESFAVSL